MIMAEAHIHVEVSTADLAKRIGDALQSDMLVDIFTAVLVERLRQDEQWGGPEHDDTHLASDWLNFIQYQWSKAAKQVPPSGIIPSENVVAYRERLIKVMALSAAALQSLNRLVSDGGVAPGAVAGDDYVIVNLEVINIDLNDPKNPRLEVREVGEDFTTAFGRNMRAKPLVEIEGKHISAPDGGNLTYSGEQHIRVRLPRWYAEDKQLGSI